ncbi:hypothetical protein CHISP_3190 [Chitinispirillum alkaliphilum]|nr:hypothetical protein CHISP_3190 [Chitinispirillum alkaliphilum]
MTHPPTGNSKTAVRPKPVIRQYKKGEVLFEENSLGRELYIIHQGKVGVYKQTPEGRVEIAVIEKGGVLGEMSLLDNLPRSATGIALERTKTVVVNEAFFQHTLQKLPSWLSSIIKIIVGRLRATNERIGQSGLRDKERGLISLILLLLPVYKKDYSASLGIDYDFVLSEALFVSRLSKQESRRILSHIEQRKIINIRKTNDNRGTLIIIDDVELLHIYKEYLELRARNKTFRELSISEESISVFSNIAYVAQKSGEETADGMTLLKSNLVSDLSETTQDKLDESLFDLKRRGLICVVPCNGDFLIIFRKESLSRIKKIRKMLPFFEMEVQ